MSYPSIVSFRPPPAQVRPPSLTELIAPILEPPTDTDSLTRYQFQPFEYVQERLNVTPWRGDGVHAGQAEVIDAYLLSLRQQHEEQAFQAGDVPADALQYYQPDQTVKRWLRVPGGHSTGKSNIAAQLANHFFDCFPGCVVSLVGPSQSQVKEVVYREIRKLREGRGLPGTVLEESMRHENRALRICVTSDANGMGGERSQGTHAPYQLVIIDESEGVPEWAKRSIESWVAGGIAIVLALANPRTRLRWFHKMKGHSYVANLEMSCLYHPNVLRNRVVIPGAVERRFVLDMINAHCRKVDVWDEAKDTFRLPWDPTGQIFEPDDEFSFRVLGKAPATVNAKCFVSPALFDGATGRGLTYQPSAQEDRATVTLGLDVARNGDDYSTLYARRGDAAWCVGEYKLPVDQGGLFALYEKVRDACLSFAADGVQVCHVRVDATGVGGGPADMLRHDFALMDAFADFRVQDIVFGAKSHDPTSFRNLITGLYSVAAEVMSRLAILEVGDSLAKLEADLTGRLYETGFLAGQLVRALEDKEKFKKKHERSCDHGDGFVMAVVPPSLLGVAFEVDYPVKPYMLAEAQTRAARLGLEWGQGSPASCAGVDAEIGRDGKVRLYLTIRRVVGELTVDVHVALLWRDPWRELLEALLKYQVPWCVVTGEGALYADALDFATRVKDVPTAKGSRFLRRVYLAQYGGTDPRPDWRDKAHKEEKLKGQETGFKYLVRLSKPHAMRWSMLRWAEGAMATPPPADLWQVVPVVGNAPACELVPSVRSETGEADVPIGESYHAHLTKTGIRKTEAGMVLVEPFGAGWVTAGMLADVGLARMETI